jgi:hypothetical protein
MKGRRSQGAYRRHRRNTRAGRQAAGSTWHVLQNGKEGADEVEVAAGGKTQDDGVGQGEFDGCGAEQTNREQAGRVVVGGGCGASLCFP